MSLLVKICGLTDAGDVAAALDAGADALGFVFAESPRRVSAKQAATISRQVPEDVLRVAVMLHPTPEEWQEVDRVFRPDVLQTDAADFASLTVSKSTACWPVYREGGVLAPDRSTTRYVYEGPRSGQGQTVNWDHAAGLAAGGGMILAGGLGPHNVVAAIRAVRPSGVDASSSLERAPGRKSGERMRAYVDAARAAADPANPYTSKRYSRP